MKRLWAAGAGFGLAGAALLAAQKPAEKPAASLSNVDRGAYIVAHMSMCVQCHTPRDESGALIMTRLLAGAPIPVSSPFPGHPWAFRAPNIRGMIGYTEEEGVRLLMEGITRNGTPPRPPMQQFGMNREDAEAVVAYLKSLR
jgi:mono/diheme cytochrome c family protein